MYVQTFRRAVAMLIIPPLALHGRSPRKDIGGSGRRRTQIQTSIYAASRSLNSPSSLASDSAESSDEEWHSMDETGVNANQDEVEDMDHDGDRTVTLTTPPHLTWMIEQRDLPDLKGKGKETQTNIHVPPDLDTLPAFPHPLEETTKSSQSRSSRHGTSLSTHTFATVTPRIPVVKFSLVVDRSTLILCVQVGRASVYNGPAQASESPLTFSMSAPEPGIIDMTPITRHDLNAFKDLVTVDIIGAVKSTLADALGQYRPQPETSGVDAQILNSNDGNLGDTEDDDDAPPIKKRRPKKPTVHRTSDTNEFHKLIREHGRLLMKRVDPKAPFADLPTEKETIIFDPTKEHCCDATRFRVDLTDTARSDWNYSAAQVFAEDFCKTYPDCGYDESAVLKAWFSHFDTLKATYERQLKEK
ncbi:hypothetical protein BV22DRAFT_1052683, partial [Leucogyrophana mollusca]